MTRLARALGYAWALPATCVGALIVFVLTFASIVEPIGWLDRAYFYKFTQKVPKWMATRYFAHPLVIGNIAVISIRKRDDVHRNTIMLHALAHVRQWMTFGVFMLVIMACTALLLRALQDTNNFYDNPLEIDARRHAKQTVDVPHLKNSVLTLIRGSRPK